MIAHDRAIVIGAGGDIAKMRGRQRVTRQRLELHDIEHLVGSGRPGRRA